MTTRARPFAGDGHGDDDDHVMWQRSSDETAGRRRPSRRQIRRRRLAVLSAVAVVAGVTTAAALSGRSGPQSSPPTVSVASSPPSSSTPATIAEPIATAPPAVLAPLAQPLKRGSSGEEVVAVQERLQQLKFEPGPIDGQFGSLTEQAVWAFEKLVMGVPREQATGVVTPEMWEFMNQPIRIEPRRWYARGEATENHTEIYLPEQVVVFFVNDEPALISHVSSGDGQIWREVVTIDPGERRNENGTEPIQVGLIGESFTPGGVFVYDRMRQGRRQAALGGMYDPAYFNFGIAVHGANEVPLYPASHGCVRMARYVGERFQQFIALGDQVFVWDGYTEPEELGAQAPAWDRIDPDWAATTTTTTTPAAPG